MEFSGLNKLTLIDYPGHLACIVFVSKCNFQCPYCHNSSLVLDEIDNKYSENDILDFLYKRKNVLEGICISGGEPTLDSGLKDFIKKIKNTTNLKIKLDTNGTNPNILFDLINENLVDYIAMDIKSSIDNYQKTTNVYNKELINNVLKSIDIIENSNINYEFRTTVVKGIHKISDFEKIGEMLGNCKHFYIQNYVDSGDILYRRKDNTKNYKLMEFNKTELKSIKNILEKYMENVQVRNI